jgi:probable HAF family extracellular repeat protein
MIDLGTLAGSNSFAVAVNPSGQVVGETFMAGDVLAHAFSWTPSGGMVDIGPGYATAVNPRGEVVGVGDHGWFYWTEAGGLVNVGTLGGSAATPLAISPTGQVVGRSLTAGNTAVHAFSWSAANGSISAPSAAATVLLSPSTREARSWANPGCQERLKSL